MIYKVAKTVSEHKMISSGDTVGVGLSGGADSVALLHILANNKEKFGIKKLKAVHIHHGIRGEEADRDSEFSRKLCEKLGVEFICYKADVPAEAEKTGESLEECARRIRYEFFEKTECDKFATAHNLNDNAETVVFNLARGSALSGLCGIPYVRDKYIRPLLDCSREDIEQFLRENNLEFVTDSTNLSDDYTRNKIRHNILPLLYEINPSFDKAFSRCIESVRLSNDYILQSANELLEKSRNEDFYECSVFGNCHTAVKNQIISLLLKENGAKNISREHIEAVADIIEKGGTANVGGKITVYAERHKLYFSVPEKTADFEIKCHLTEHFLSTPVGEYAINIHDKKDLQKLNKEDMDNFIDCDKISSDVSVRNRREGDKYRRAGKAGKTLKKLFNEFKTPVCERSKMLILSDECGIIWTEYFGVSERCKADANTKKYAEIIKVGD